MKIIERFILGKKGNPELCEDGLVITENIIAVVDGATAKGAKEFDSLPSGAFARKVICDILSSPGADRLCCEELIRTLSDALRKRSDECYSNLEYSEYPRASVIVYNRHYSEIWAYGDCQCIVHGTLHTHEKKVDTLISELRAFYLEAALTEGDEFEDFAVNDVGRERILGDIKKQFVFENKACAYGYPVINGFGIRPKMIVRYKVEAGDEVVLASDGYPFLKDTLAESESCLQDVLENDPMCFRIYKTTKGVAKGNLSFDDRCYCRFIV